MLFVTRTGDLAVDAAALAAALLNLEHGAHVFDSLYELDDADAAAVAASAAASAIVRDRTGRPALVRGSRRRLAACAAPVGDGAEVRWRPKNLWLAFAGAADADLVARAAELANAADATGAPPSPAATPTGLAPAARAGHVAHTAVAYISTAHKHNAGCDSVRRDSGPTAARLFVDAAALVFGENKPAASRPAASRPAGRRAPRSDAEMMAGLAPESGVNGGLVRIYARGVFDQLEIATARYASTSRSSPRGELDIESCSRVVSAYDVRIGAPYAVPFCQTIARVWHLVRASVLCELGGVVDGNVLVPADTEENPIRVERIFDHVKTWGDVPPRGGPPPGGIPSWAGADCLVAGEYNQWSAEMGVASVIVVEAPVLAPFAEARLLRGGDLLTRPAPAWLQAAWLPVSQQWAVELALARELFAPPGAKEPARAMRDGAAPYIGRYSVVWIDDAPALTRRWCGIAEFGTAFRRARALPPLPPACPFCRVPFATIAVEFCARLSPASEALGVRPADDGDAVDEFILDAPAATAGLIASAAYRLPDNPRFHHDDEYMFSRRTWRAGVAVACLHCYEAMAGGEHESIDLLGGHLIFRIPVALREAPRVPTTRGFEAIAAVFGKAERLEVAGVMPQVKSRGVALNDPEIPQTRTRALVVKAGVPGAPFALASAALGPVPELECDELAALAAGGFAILPGVEIVTCPDLARLCALAAGK